MKNVCLLKRKKTELFTPRCICQMFLTKDTKACREIDCQPIMGSYLDVLTNYYVSAKCLSVVKTWTSVNQRIVNKMQHSYLDVLVNCFLTKGMEVC